MTFASPKKAGRDNASGPLGIVSAYRADEGTRDAGQCCSNRDCTEIPASRVTEGPEGYRVVLVPGDHAFVKAQVSFLIPYDQAKPSPDGVYHICINEAMKMLCFFAGAKGA